MEMYQVEITTDMDVVNIIVNASDENVAIVALDDIDHVALAHPCG